MVYSRVAEFLHNNHFISFTPRIPRTEQELYHVPPSSTTSRPGGSFYTPQGHLEDALETPSRIPNMVAEIGLDDSGEEFFHEFGFQNRRFNDIEHLPDGRYVRFTPEIPASYQVTRRGYVAAGLGTTGLITTAGIGAYGLSQWHASSPNNAPTTADKKPTDAKSPPADGNQPVATAPTSVDDALNTYKDINTKLQQTGNERNPKLLQQQALQYSIVASARNLKALNLSDDKIKAFIEKALKQDNNLLTFNGDVLPFNTPGAPKLPPGFFLVRLPNGEIVGEQKYALSLTKQEVRVLDLGSGKVHILDYTIQDSKQNGKNGVLSFQPKN